MSAGVSRRRLLSTVGIAVGALGLTGATRSSTPPRRAALPGVIHGADWRIVWPGVKPGTLPPIGATRLPSGRLVDADGGQLGTFDASPLPAGGARNGLLHTLELADGSITAVGPATFDEATFAVVGGTGRFSGASGSYHLVQRPAPSGGTATFTLDITTPEA